MKTYQDLTDEQILEIGKLAFSNLYLKKIPFEENHRIQRKMNLIGLFDDNDYWIWITPALNISIGRNPGFYVPQNQYKIQKLFVEWGIEPKYDTVYKHTKDEL